MYNTFTTHWILDGDILDEKFHVLHNNAMVCAS